MRQFRRLKQEHPDCILLFRCGDFYETYFEDADEAGRLLNIVVTRKTAGVDGEVAMAGVPYHAIESYLAKLVKSGRSVAIAEQMEDPKQAKGLVRRDIVRVITPGTALEPGILDDRANNYLMAITWQPARGGAENETCGAGAPAGLEDLFGREENGLRGSGCVSPPETASARTDAASLELFSEKGVFGIAIADLSTGAFAVTELEGPRAREEVFSELVRLEPAEILLPEGFPEAFVAAATGGIGSGGGGAGAVGGIGESRARLTRRPADRFDPARSRRLLQRHFGVQSLEGFGAEHLSVALGAAGAALDYLQETQKGAIAHLRELRVWRTDDCLVLDAVTQRSLELVRNLHSGGRDGTLLAVIDRTRTAMGGRLLRQWVLSPLGRAAEIERRLDAVEEFFHSLALRSRAAESLAGLPDLERVASRVACGRAGPRDLSAIRAALDRLPRLAAALEPARSELLAATREGLDPLDPLRDRLRRALTDDPPLTARDGGVIRPGWNAELDEIKTVAHDTKGWIAAFRAREAQRLNLPNLKVGFNKVFGYYIELTNAQLRQIGDLPADYQRRQTIANGERFITPELKEKEEIILHAEERINGLEARLFEELRLETASQVEAILAQGRLLARLDALLGLAEAALAGGYVRPRINDDGRIEIRDGRHPVLEAVQVDAPFVPNDTRLDSDTRQIGLITGPNMAGKSTYIRQVALIALMAHVGSFVPAREADIALLDRIFTRVGAMDHLARGQSTFLVEMLETANILNNATDKSLVILDEIGRGTSTYDGISIAWAVLEHLHNTPGRRPRTLFATHYHELTDLEGRLPRLRNYNVAVVEDPERIVFLYKIVNGAADRSYGIYAAKLAGVPARAIRRARSILKSLENGQALAVDSGAGASKGGNAENAKNAKNAQNAGNAENAEGVPGESAASSAPVKPRRRGGRLGFLDEFEAARQSAVQLSLFDAPPHPALERLRGLQIDRLTPLEALNLLQELKKLAEK